MDPSTETAPDTFAWSAHPAGERAGRAVAVVLVIAAFATVAGILMTSAAWGVAAGVILLLTLNRFFFRSRFTIDDDGITARYPLRRKHARWPEFRAFVLDENGGFLSTRARRPWLRTPTGIQLYFGRQRDAAVERIRSRLPEGVGSWAH